MISSRALLSDAEDVISALSGQMPLSEMCSKIGQIDMLRRAKIVATECYIREAVVHHRYLIFEIVPPSVEPKIWLRVDRLRAGSLLAFFLHFGTSPAHDMVHTDYCSSLDAISNSC